MKIHISRRAILIAVTVIIALVAVGLVLFLRAAEDIFANITTKDCRWGATVVVWDDANRDGLRDEDETPLQNVAVYADDVRNNITRVASGTSDTTGTTKLDTFIAGCPDTAFEVYAAAPANLCATTPERLAKSPYSFGFAACAASDG